jgi:hypothetical protein
VLGSALMAGRAVALRIIAIGCLKPPQRNESRPGLPDVISHGVPTTQRRAGHFWP